MPNQMIALQARAPQAPNLGAAATRYANMMAQQIAARRQAEVAQQTMEIQKAQEDRAAALAGPQLDKTKLEYLAAQTTQFKNEAANIAPDDKAGWAALREEIVKAIPGWGSRLPTAEQWNADTRLRVLFDAEKVINKTIPTPQASVVYDKKGNAFEARVGGSGERGVFPLQGYEFDPNAASGNPTPPAAPSKFDQAFAGGIPAAPEQIDAAAAAIRKGAGVSDPALRDLSPNDYTAAQQRASRAALETPISMTQGQPDLASIVQTMMDTGVVSESGLKAMQAAAPGKDAQLAQLLQANNIRIMPDEAGPSMRSAVYRPDQDAVPLQRALQGGEAPMLEQTQYRPTGRQFQGRDPMQSPQSNPAPAPIVGANAAAEEGGKQGVRVITEPQIVAGEERVRRLEKLRGDLPKARQETAAFISDLTQKIQAIDEFLRNPYRNTIIGPIEGNLPDFAAFGERGNALAQWNFITNNTTLQKLIDDRKATETGASPQGIVSDRDLGVAANAASKATRRGTLDFNDNELQRVRDVWYGSLQRALRGYNDTYREVMAPGFVIEPPAVAPRYKQSPKPKPTPDDISYLQRNRSNPDVVNGFRKHFGEQAFKQYMGGR